LGNLPSAILWTWPYHGYHTYWITLPLEETGCWLKLPCKGLQNLYSSPNIVSVIRSIFYGRGCIGLKWLRIGSNGLFLQSCQLNLEFYKRQSISTKWVTTEIWLFQV
jgi:hypothetical protein